jgi:hypothetical protein
MHSNSNHDLNHFRVEPPPGDGDGVPLQGGEGLLLCEAVERFDCPFEIEGGGRGDCAGLEGDVGRVMPEGIVDGAGCDDGGQPLESLFDGVVDGRVQPSALPSDDNDCGGEGEAPDARFDAACCDGGQWLEADGASCDGGQMLPGDEESYNDLGRQDEVDEERCLGPDNSSPNRLELEDSPEGAQDSPTGPPGRWSFGTPTFGLRRSSRVADAGSALPGQAGAGGSAPRRHSRHSVVHSKVAMY